MDYFNKNIVDDESLQLIKDISVGLFVDKYISISMLCRNCYSLARKVEFACQKSPRLVYTLYFTLKVFATDALGTG